MLLLTDQPVKKANLITKIIVFHSLWNPNDKFPFTMIIAQLINHEITTPYCIGLKTMDQQNNIINQKLAWNSRRFTTWYIFIKLKFKILESLKNLYISPLNFQTKYATKFNWHFSSKLITRLAQWSSEILLALWNTPVLLYVHKHIVSSVPFKIYKLESS